MSEPVSPDCADGHKCHACSGDAWDLSGDRPAHCACRCHDVTHSKPHAHDTCPDGADAHEDYCLNGRQE